MLSFSTALAMYSVSSKQLHLSSCVPLTRRYAYFARQQQQQQSFIDSHLELLKEKCYRHYKLTIGLTRNSQSLFEAWSVKKRI